MGSLSDEVRELIFSDQRPNLERAEEIISRVADMEDIVQSLAASDVVNPRFSSPATRTAIQKLAVRARDLVAEKNPVV